MDLEEKEISEQKAFASFEEDERINSPSSPSADDHPVPNSSKKSKKKKPKNKKKEIMFVELPKAMRIYFRFLTFASILFGSYMLLGTSLKIIEFLFKVSIQDINHASDAIFVVAELFFIDEIPLWACLAFAFPTVDYSCFNTSRQSRIVSVQQETAKKSGKKGGKKQEKVNIYDFAVNGIVLVFLLWEFGKQFFSKKKQKLDVGFFDTEVFFFISFLKFSEMEMV